MYGDTVEIEIISNPIGEQLENGAPGFVSDWDDLREHNRRRSKADVEDCASKDRPEMT